MKLHNRMSLISTYFNPKRRSRGENLIRASMLTFTITKYYMHTNNCIVRKKSLRQGWWALKLPKMTARIATDIARSKFAEMKGFGYWIKSIFYSYFISFAQLKHDPIFHQKSLIKIIRAFFTSFSLSIASR